MRHSGLTLRTLLLVIFVAIGSIACQPSPTPDSITPVILRNWEDDISQEILDAFEEKTGIPVVYIPYESQEEAIADMRNNEVYDIVILENQLVPGLVEEGLLAELNHQNIPNFKNISPNFRDLAYDPGNHHAIPYSWGTTGLVVRTDLASQPVTSWAALWEPEYAGKIIGWPLSRYMIGIALKSLGYSANTEDPDELAAAQARLFELKPHITLLDWEPAVSAPYLISGEAIIAIGQADDITAAKEAGADVAYVMPEEGGILWGDNFTIPANSENKENAEKLINFLLSAEISAKIINETCYWLPNDAALPLVNEEIRNNPAIFPPATAFQGAEILLALTPEAEARYEEIWQQFLAIAD